MSEPAVAGDEVAVEQQDEDEEEEDSDLFASDDPEASTHKSDASGDLIQNDVFGYLAPTGTDGPFVGEPQQEQQNNLTIAVSSEFTNSESALQPTTENLAVEAAPPAAVVDQAKSSPPTLPDTGLSDEGVPLSSMEGTPKVERDVIHIPRKSHVESPFSPSKPTASSSTASTTSNAASFGLPAGVVIPASVDSSLLQGRLLETLRNLPLQLINDALVEYDDAVQIKGEAIRNRGAYLYGVIKRYVHVQERAARGETEGSLPMGPELTPAVQERLNKLVENGFCSHEEMNDKIKSKIRMLSERDALFAVDELASVERYQIRNFGSYFMGILNRYMRGEAQSGAAKAKTNEARGGPQRFDDRKPDDRPARGRSPDRDRRVNLGRERYGEPFRRDRSRDRVDQQQHRNQPHQQGDHLRRYRPNDADSFRRNPDSFVDRSRYDNRHQDPQQQFAGGQHRQQQDPSMALGGFVNSVPPPPPRSNALGLHGMGNFQQQFMQPNQQQPLAPQQPFPMQQPQQQFMSPLGAPSTSFPGQPPTNAQQNYQQQTPVMNQLNHQFSHQSQPPLMSNQPQMMSQQQPRSMGGNQQSSYMGNQMQSSMPGSFQHQQPAMMNVQPQQQLPYQQQPMIPTQSHALQGSSYTAGPQAAGGWQQSQAPVDILGLADKAASAVQALAASQNKLHIAASYAGGTPIVSDMSSSFPISQQQQQPPMNQYGNHSGINTNQYAPRQQSGPPPPPNHLQHHQQQQQQNQHQNQQRRPYGRTIATLEDLPVNVQYAIQHLMATQQVDGPLDTGILGMIKDLPESLALTAIQKFTTIDKNTMRNKTAYLAGVLRRELEKINRR